MFLPLQICEFVAWGRQKLYFLPKETRDFIDMLYPLTLRSQNVSNGHQTKNGHLTSKVPVIDWLIAGARWVSNGRKNVVFGMLRGRVGTIVRIVYQKWQRTGVSPSIN
jgi:hypothetical protein